MLSALTYRIAARLPPPVRRLARQISGLDRLRPYQADTPIGRSPKSGSLRPVVYLPTWISWGVLHERPHFVLETFASAGHPVYFVDPRAPKRRRDGAITIVPDVGPVPAAHVIIYTHFPKTRELITHFDDAVVVYDILDDLSMYALDEEGLAAEQRAAHHHTALIGDADIVIASSPVLRDRHLKERPDVLLVENGVNVARFSLPVSRPDDLPPGTVIGYHGSVQPWFHFDLLHAVAGDRPDWQFAIVGPVNPAVAEAAARVERLGNVTFLGERPPRSMPAYAQAFDVGVVWRVVDDMTAGMTPLKLNEYLAAGTPVVSTPLPASKAQPEVITASDAAGMIDAVEEALRQRTDSAWQARAASAAAEADWARRIDPLMRRLETERGRRVP